MMKLSIIIPVYNSFKYLDKCINSLINQTISELEFIFVNDGTPDNSVKIIKKYQKNDDRIKLLEKENGGQASARNLGLSVATGEYIAFLDADDYVSLDMYEIMYNRAKKDNLDIVVCNYYLSYSDRAVEMKNDITSLSEKEITRDEYLLLSPSPCNKIFKRKYLEREKFKFPEGIIYEDLASIPLLGLGDPKVVYLNKCLYYYVQSDVSTMRNKEYNSKYENIFKAIKYLYDHMVDKGNNMELEYLLVYHYLYLGSLNFYKYKKYKNIDRISNDMKKYFPNWDKNKLVRLKFNKKEMLYMKLFYYKKYFLINIYRRLFNKNEQD